MGNGQLLHPRKASSSPSLGAESPRSDPGLIPSVTQHLCQAGLVISWDIPGGIPEESGWQKWGWNHTRQGLQSPGAALALLALLESSWHFLLHPAEWIWAIIYSQGLFEGVSGMWVTASGHSRNKSTFLCFLEQFGISLQVLTPVSICLQISGRNIVNEDTPKLLAGPEASIRDR